MSSDFAISRFKHLGRLLLVHGHWCSSRLANMVLYFIYKNVVGIRVLKGFKMTLVQALNQTMVQILPLIPCRCTSTCCSGTSSSAASLAAS